MYPLLTLKCTCNLQTSREGKNEQANLHSIFKKSEVRQDRGKVKYLLFCR